VTSTADLRNVLVDAVGVSEHDDRISRDDYHAGALLLAASLSSQRVVENDATISIAAIAGAAVTAI